MGQNNVRFLQPLGKGSCGEVYKAKWNGKLVAAKRIHPLLVGYDNGDHEGVVAKFVEECELLRRLKHSNILEVLHVTNESNQPPILITELLDCDLRKHFYECETLALEELVYIMLDVAKGLQYLHGQDEPIIHRDLCPKNILLDKRNPDNIRAKIADVGLARIIGDARSVLSPVPGTPLYMAPETHQSENSQSQFNYGTEMDIFSFGMTLLEGIIGRSLEEPKEDLEEIDEDNPLRKLVMECLEKDPKKRPSAEDIVKSLSEQTFMKVIFKYDFQSQESKVCQEFVRLIPVRRRTIRELEEMNLHEMTTALDAFHRKTNIATAAGATTSVVATGLVVGGFISSFFTFGATIPVMIAGGTVAAAGGLTTFGAKMSEIFVTRTNIKKVEDAIAKDKEESEHLRKSIEKLDKLIKRNVRRIFDKAADFDQQSDEFSQNDVLKYFEEITGIEIMETDQLHPIKDGARAVGTFISAASSGVTAGAAGARIGTAVFDTLSVASRATHVAGFVASILSLPIDAYFLNNSVRELNNNSPSEVADKIREIKRKMICPKKAKIPSLIKEYVKSKIEDEKKLHSQNENLHLIDDVDDILPSNDESNETETEQLFH